MQIKEPYKSFYKTALYLVGILLFCLLWVWFGFQYGFNNSPDSWHRGVLGKSIVEGHPLFINFMQGWVYDYPLWHYTASHEPLLPVLYALYFLFAGFDISIANYVSCTSAALLLFPLIGISRRLCHSFLPGLCVYILLVFNEENSFLWEVTAGLSIPTTTALLFLALCGTLFTLEKENSKIRFATSIAWVLFYYNRSPEQLIFLWLMLWCLVFSFFFLAREIFRRMLLLWGSSFLLVLPWMLRKFYLFGNPLFTDLAPAVWTDRGYDYFTYHENVPYPSPRVYFASHSLADALYKFVIQGSQNCYRMLNDITFGPAWIYLLLTLISIISLLLLLKDRYKKVWLLLVAATLVGYYGIYSVSPMLDHRYFIPVHLSILVICMFALTTIIERLCHPPYLRSVIYFLGSCLLIITTQHIFWDDFSEKYLHYSYSRPGLALLHNPDLKRLREKLSGVEAILAPFSEVQRLSFATGLNFIELPDNYTTIINPAEFFRRYHITYSLVDLSQVLPSYMITGREIIGNEVVYSINYDAQPKSESSENPPAIEKGAFKPFKQTTVFIDTYHGNDIPTCFFNTQHTFKHLYATGLDYVSSKQQLLSSDLLLLRFAKTELRPEEMEVLSEFINKGGRILVMSHGWVWTSYRNESLEKLPGNLIAKYFDTFITASMVDGPFKGPSKEFPSDEINEVLLKQSTTFSSISLPLEKPAEIALQGHSGETIAAGVHFKNSRLFIWGHDHLLDPDVACDKKTEPFVNAIFQWLLTNK